MDALTRCRGSFALVHYLQTNSTLQLATDALGLRAIYYTLQDGILFFATALKVLEAIPQVHKNLSQHGMAELSVFKFPLANRTPYDEIKVLRECEVLTANSGGISLDTYFDWSDSENTIDNLAPTTTALYEAFRESVALRNKTDKCAYSFLSGGMDSRAIAATLVDLGIKVEALNFSPDASQDRHYAQLFAEQAGAICRLHILPSGGNYPNFSFLALAAKSKLESEQSTGVERRQCIWSGDGGSVGLGHVYMNERMVELAEQGDMRAAIQQFFSFNRLGLPKRILKSSSKKTLPDLIFQSVLSEINRYPRKDVGRQIYLFLLFNDQRRHLFNHFETIDQHGLELLTPFFDTVFLRAIAGTPVREGLLHGLYAKWFELMPDFTRNAPWQTYPGHVPCPIADGRNLKYQWSERNTPYRATFSERLRLAVKLVNAFDSNVRPQPFSYSRICIAAIAQTAGLTDSRYLIEYLNIYKKYNKRVSNF